MGSYFFFFKQRTAYEMRISDWSSDVCSADLHMALRLRSFGHKTTALRSVVSGLLGGGAAVTAAYAGLGLWALVIQRIVTEIISTLLSRASYRWTPGWAFRWPTLKRNLSINGSLTATQLVFIFTTRLQELVIGSVIGVVAVGIRSEEHTYESSHS